MELKFCLRALQSLLVACKVSIQTFYAHELVISLDDLKKFQLRKKGDKAVENYSSGKLISYDQNSPFLVVKCLISLIIINQLMVAPKLSWKL
jgi:hypothetical protein